MPDTQVRLRYRMSATTTGRQTHHIVLICSDVPGEGPVRDNEIIIGSGETKAEAVAVAKRNLEKAFANLEVDSAIIGKRPRRTCGNCRNWQRSESSRCRDPQRERRCRSYMSHLHGVFTSAGESCGYWDQQ